MCGENVTGETLWGEQFTNIVTHGKGTCIAYFGETGVRGMSWGR